MPTVEDRDMRNNLVFISCQLGQCDLLSVNQTESVALTQQQGQEIGMFFLLLAYNLSSSTAGLVTTLSVLQGGNHVSVEIPCFSLEEYRVCSKEKTSGSVQQNSL